MTQKIINKINNGVILIYTSYIYELKNWTPRKRDLLVEFQGKFFRKSLTSGARFCKFDSINEADIELIQFFCNIDRAKRTMVIVSKYSNEIIEEPVARGVLGQLVGGTEKIPLSKVIWQQGDLLSCREKSSQFLRQSSSLKGESFENKDFLHFVAEGHGIAIIDTTQNPFPQQERAARLSQVVALAHAYLSVLDDVIENLGVVGSTNKNQSEKELRKWSEFMSACYFAEPVNLNTIELSSFYRAISESQKIELHAKEVTEQLRLLAELVRLDRIETEEKREKSLQRFINLFAVFGVLLTFFSLSQVTQVTPKIVADFKHQWAVCFKQFGASCLIGGYEEKLATQESTKPASISQIKQKSSKKSEKIIPKRDEDGLLKDDF